MVTRNKRIAMKSRVVDTAEADHMVLADASVTGSPKAVELVERRRKAVDLLAGLWKARLGEPIDGVEYQTEMRAAWDRNT